MIEGFDIICIATSNWEQPWGSRQQIMSRLSSGNRVLFVEYQFSFLHFLKFPQFLPKLFTSRIRHITTNLIIYRPWLNLPFGYYNKAINLINQWWLLLQLKRLIKKLGFSKIILWTFEPTSYFLADKLNTQISIFHCIDSTKDEKNIPKRKRCIEEMEEELCRKSDIIFTLTARSLSEKIKLNKNTHLLPSAVSESFFDVDYPSAVSSHLQFISDIPKPRIGFVGTLNNRIDYKLIDFIAKRRPDWHIVLIGAISIKKIVNFLKGRKNIHFLGCVEHNSLPFYIKSFDVGIIPYKINDFTRGISPIKVFEYLAFGKPVVASQIPALEALSAKGLIKVTTNKEDFLESILQYLTYDSPDTYNSRLDFAKDNTWRKRVEFISEVLDKDINSRFYGD